jgi:2-polyprenyl-3-methyl-5-hydroxy-6-metoxy-1,4-benzoquinol methylase
MLAFVPGSARTILDVGGHSGGFAHTLRGDDPSRVLWGVEADAEVAALAGPQYDRLLVGPYPGALAGVDVRFDCIVFNDVLEHMVDPWTALRATVAHLAPDGVVVASIPNVRNVKVVLRLVVLGDWTYTDMGVLDRTHVRFFTRRTIRSSFAHCGFAVDRLEGINPVGGDRVLPAKVAPILLGDFAYTGFAVRARPLRKDGEHP